MRVLKHVQYTGRKSSTGKLCFDENDRAVVFVDYCPDCRGKVAMSRQEAQRFASLYYQEARSLGEKITNWLMRRRQLPDTPLQQSDDRDELKREILQEMALAMQNR